VTVTHVTECLVGSHATLCFITKALTFTAIKVFLCQCDAFSEEVRNASVPNPDLIFSTKHSLPKRPISI